jgi:flagellar biosynthesis/type III secretory pathway protein FliH
MLADYAFELYNGDFNWLDRRIFYMKDIEPQDLRIVKRWRKEWEQKAQERGLEQGMEQGMEQGLISQRQTVLKLTAARFPALAALAQEQVDQIKDLTLLQDLTVSVGLAATEEEAHQVLLNWPHQSKKSA